MEFFPTSHENKNADRFENLLLAIVT